MERSMATGVGRMAVGVVGGQAYYHPANRPLEDVGAGPRSEAWLPWCLIGQEKNGRYNPWPAP
jgi:hypothetical protein